MNDIWGICMNLHYNIRRGKYKTNPDEREIMMLLGKGEIAISKMKAKTFIKLVKKNLVRLQEYYQYKLFDF